MNFNEEEPREVRAINEFAASRGFTAVGLPQWYDVAWALVDDKGVVQNWAHAIEVEKFDDYIPVDLALWRAGRSLYMDTGAPFILVVFFGDGAIKFLSTPAMPWEFGVDQETLEPMAYVKAKFLVDSEQVESRP